jgi:hypothetical protein
MSETPGVYNVGVPRPQPPPTFEMQLKTLPPAVRSVAESLALRDMEGVSDRAKTCQNFTSNNRSLSPI